MAITSKEQSQQRRKGTAEFGRLEIGPDRKVTCIDMRLESAAVFGATPEQLKELEREFAESNAYINQQLQEAAEAKAKKEQQDS